MSPFSPQYGQNLEVFSELHWVEDRKIGLEVPSPVLPGGCAPAHPAWRTCGQMLCELLFCGSNKKWAEVLQRRAVEHESMQAAFTQRWPLRLHTGKEIWEKAISDEGSQYISTELAHSNWANEVVLFHLGSQGQELKPQMQSPSLRWQREEKTTYPLILEKREEPFPLTAPTSVPASILEMLIFQC